MMFWYNIIRDDSINRDANIRFDNSTVRYSIFSTSASSGAWYSCLSVPLQIVANASTLSEGSQSLHFAVCKTYPLFRSRT